MSDLRKVLNSLRVGLEKYHVFHSYLGATSRCYGCGFRIRGENHEEGEHHKQGTSHKRRAHIGPARRGGKGN